MTRLRLLPNVPATATAAATATVIAVAVAALALAAAPGAARAAEAYDNCTGFIASVPTNISTQGTWCFDKDLATSSTAGPAIEVSTNNVTIDCNGFKLGNLAAGPASEALGLFANSRRNVTIRNCVVRGFGTGIYLNDTLATGGGHLVENNRVEDSGMAGIVVIGSDMIVRNNQLHDIGYVEGGLQEHTQGIRTVGPAEVTNNIVSGVRAFGEFEAAGISTSGFPSVVRENVVRGIFSPDGDAFGIFAGTAGVSMRGNDVVGLNLANSYGIQCTGPGNPIRDNVVGGWSTAAPGCVTGGDNVMY